MQKFLNSGPGRYNISVYLAFLVHTGTCSFYECNEMEFT